MSARDCKHGIVGGVVVGTSECPCGQRFESEAAIRAHLAQVGYAPDGRFLSDVSSVDSGRTTTVFDCGLHSGLSNEKGARCPTCSPVDEQARERAFGAAYETSDPRENFDAGWDAALAAARPVSAQAREGTPWTGRALFERFEHEAERGRGWPRLSKVGKHSWDALAEQIEGEVLAAARPVPIPTWSEAVVWLRSEFAASKTDEIWNHYASALADELLRAMPKKPDLLAVEKLSRARGLAEAIMRVGDDDCGLREIAAEIVSLLAAVPSVAQAPKFPTIAEAERLLPNAKKVADGHGVSYDEAPLYVGLVATGPASEGALARGRELAAEHGWVSMAQAPTPEDEPRGDGVYENGRGARASGRSLQENPYRREADYARWAQGWLDEHHGKPRIVRAPTGTGDAGNGPCIRCGRSDYTGLGGAYWFADNDLWNEVVEDRVGIFCPACFAALCAEKGIAIGFRAGRVGVVEEGSADAALAARPVTGTEEEPDAAAALLRADDSEIAVVPDTVRRAWEPTSVGYTREDFKRDRDARTEEEPDA